VLVKVWKKDIVDFISGKIENQLPDKPDSKKKDNQIQKG